MWGDTGGGDRRGHEGGGRGGGRGVKMYRGQRIMGDSWRHTAHYGSVDTHKCVGVVGGGQGLV